MKNRFSHISHTPMPLDISSLLETIKEADNGRALSFSSLLGSSGPLFFVGLNASALLVCASEEGAQELYEDAVFWSKYFKKELPVLVSSSRDPRRLKYLSRLYTDIPQKIIASVDSLQSPVWHKNDFTLLRISRGESLEREVFIQDLYGLGYHSVPVVTGVGEMSLRAGILDIFPPDAESPVRVEFFADEIESLRYFDTDTQMSVQEIDNIHLCPAVEPEKGANIIDLLPEHKLLLVEPDNIKIHNDDLYQVLFEKGALSLTALPLEGEDHHCPINSIAGLGLLRDERKSMEEFVKRVQELRQDKFLLLACSSEGQAKRLKDLFLDMGTDIPILKNIENWDATYRAVILQGKLSSGFVIGNSIVLAERDIFGKRPVYRPIRKSRVSKLISTIEDFQKGDYLVHIEHGIGKFLGIKKEKIEDYEGDFITIEYQGGDKLFVPLDRIHFVQKYHAPENAKPRIDKLGGSTWKRTQQRVKKKIKDMAAKLIKIYAKRTTAKGTAFSNDREMHSEFDGFFPYEETPDQISSINEIKKDMEQTQPMDRLLCGDVGYGKTEVVMRACFKAVYDSKQAAVLVPTTILAEQHYETFTARFSAFPVTVDYLSRFKSKQEQKETLKNLLEGQIDIIIGTHRLLGKDVMFANLGLLVIDEEHKFGVSHKEKIKALKANVDVLTLSATPIPRTLHMALSGIRGMSTIETPPEDRLAVQSSVARFNPSLIKEALEKELDRDGQAFFVHNRIRDIYQIANFLRDLVPSGRIGVAHGQMRERELELVMKAFFHQEINILVSTAIIGSGLDIPTANTIFINRADRFGLADLYQLRGRVGRSDAKAYAYFLIPGEDIITEEARKKLHAIQELGYLGAGFRLAIRDLEIRGAGNLLGAEQSGHIEAVGFDMYMNMMEAAVAELKGETVVTKSEPVIELHITAIIPDEYIEDPDIRLTIYRKIASAKTIQSLDRIRVELKDRFGAPPEATKRLVDIMEIKLMAMKLCIERIQNIHGTLRLFFAQDTPVDSNALFSLYDSRKGYLKFLPEGGIELDYRSKKWHDIFKELKDVMEELEPPKKP